MKFEGRVIIENGTVNVHPMMMSKIFVIKYIRDTLGLIYLDSKDIYDKMEKDAKNLAEYYKSLL